MPFRFGGDAVHVYFNKNNRRAARRVRHKRSLSRKGNPYDNAVVESTNRLLKKELVYRNHYTTIEQPRRDLNDYVWWSDNQRLHSTLGYRSPKEFTEQGTRPLRNRPTHRCNPAAPRGARGAGLDTELRQIAKARLLIIDEFGYMPIDEEGSRLLFQVISDSYETRSVVYTTNIEFSGWGRVLGDKNMAAALIDRTVHHAGSPDSREAPTAASTPS